MRSPLAHDTAARVDVALRPPLLRAAGDVHVLEDVAQRVRLVVHAQLHSTQHSLSTECTTERDTTP